MMVYQYGWEGIDEHLIVVFEAEGSSCVDLT